MSEIKNMAYWKAKNASTQPHSKSPGKFLMKAAGMLIGANKRRQATEDLADKQSSEGIQAAYSRKLS